MPTEGQGEGQQDQQSEQQPQLPPTSTTRPLSHVESGTSVAEQWQAVIRQKEATISGQQGHINNLTKNVEKTQAELEAERQAKTTVAQELSQVQTTLQQLQATVAALTTQNEKLVTENTVIKRKGEVRAKISSEFPALAPFYEKGLLKDNVEAMSDDDLATYLTSYQETLGTAKTGHRREEYSGALPPPPTGDSKEPPGQTVDQILTDMNEAARIYGMRSPQYQEVFQLYQSALLTGKAPLVRNRNKELDLGRR